MADFDAYRDRLDAILAAVDRLSDTEIRFAIAVLKDARSELVDRMLAAAGNNSTYTTTVLQSLLVEVNRIGFEYDARLRRHMTDALRQAWDLGASAIPSSWEAGGIEVRFTLGLDTRLLDVASQISADMIRDVSRQFIDGVTREIRLGVLGAASVQATISKVQAYLATQPQRLTGKLGPLVYQAERIVRTEIMRVYSLADEARRRQAKELVPGLRKYWLATPDARTRPDHLSAWARYRPGGIVGPIDIDADFIVGGERAAYPYDPRLSARQIVNCFVGSTVVSAPDIRRGFSRWYEGEVVTIETANGNQLTGTPNHPIATAKGWIALGSLNKGDYVLSARDKVHPLSGYPDVNHRPAAFAEVLDSLRMMGRRERVAGAAVNFHGERPRGDIDVVTAVRELGDHVAPRRHQAVGNLWFPSADILAGALSSDGRARENRLSLWASTYSGMGGSGQFGSLSSAQLPHSHEVRSTSAAYGDSVAVEASAYRAPGYAVPSGYGEFRLPTDVEIHNLIVRNVYPERPTELHADALQVGANVRVGRTIGVGDRADAFAAGITFDHIVRVERKMFGGQVYNLETGTAWYFANGIVAHNCRCRAVTWKPEWDSKEEAA